MSRPTSALGSPPPSRRRLTLWAVLAGTLILVVSLLVAGLAVGLGGDTESAGTSSTPDATTPDATPQEPAGSAEPEASDEPLFRDWLAPSETLRVGQNRYVSPCQALGLDDLREIYGDTPSDMFITETSLDASVADRSSLSAPFPTDCNYGNGRLVVLHAEQYTRASDLQQGGLGQAAYSLGLEGPQARPKIRRYRAALELTDDPVLRRFVAGLVRASQKMVTYRRTFRLEALDGLDLDSTVLPVGPEAFSFNFFQDNVTYRLTHSYAGTTDDLSDLSDEQVLQELAKAMDAVTRIRENIGDPELSQSPAPTVIGDSGTVGSSVILEPCAILTKQVFSRVTGRKANEPVRRTTLMQEPRATTSERLSSGHTCQRSSRRDVGYFGADVVGMELQINYSDTRRQLDRTLRAEEFLPLDADDTRLRTRAGWAAEISTPGFPPYYKFIVDGYWVGVAITDLQSEDQLGGEIDQGQGSRADHVRAINTLVPVLRRHLEQARRDLA